MIPKIEKKKILLFVVLNDKKIGSFLHILKYPTYP